MRKIFWPTAATTVLISLVLVSGAPSAAAVGAEPLQQLRTLSHFPDGEPTAINASGAVAGADSGDVDPHGFVTDPTNSTTTDLRPLNDAADTSGANAINDAGMAAGQATNYHVGDDVPPTATVWDTGGGATDLGTIGNRPCTSSQDPLSCDSSDALGINDHGVVVGRSNLGDGAGGTSTHAFVEDLATMVMTDIGTLPGGTTSEALGVNDSGLVVGDSETSDGNGGVVTHAFVYELATATMRDIGTLPGGTSSVARAVNRHGLVVGDSSVQGGAVHPFTYDVGTGVMADLGLPAGATSAGASGLNGDGVVVGSTESGGYVYDPASTSFAMIAGARSAVAINDTGKVVGVGSVPDPDDPTVIAFGSYFTSIRLSPPSAPTNLHITTTCGTAPALRWTASPPTPLAQPSGYVIFRNGLMVAKVTGTAYTDGSATASSVYTVAAINSDGLSAMSNSVRWSCTPGLSGTVTSGDAPIGGVDVRVYQAGTGTLAAKAQTDPAGDYGLPALAPGSYNVRFSDAAGRVVLAWNGGAATQATAPVVVVVAGSPTVVDADLVAAGHIHGTMTSLDPIGLPQPQGEDVRVYALGGGQVAKVSGYGTYDVGGLPPGSYQVLFTDPSLRTVTVWNGGSTDRTHAPAITVTAGQSTEIDVSVPVAAVELGTVTGAGAPLPGIDVRFYVAGTGTLAAKTVTGSDGTYTLAILPGTYQIRFSDPTNTFALQWANGATKQSHAHAFTLAAGVAPRVDATLVGTS